MTHITKHTPGPWVVVSTFNGTRFVETQEGHSVCVLADTNDAANAHLIAAAPAMYEVLIKARQRIIQLAHTVNTLSNKLELGDKVRAEYFYDIIDNVLSQAEGR